MWATPGFENWSGAFPYFYLIFFLSIIVLLNISLSRRLEFYLFVTVIFYLIIFTGLREDTGGDWFRYNKYFNNTSNLIFEDVGFILLILATKYLGFSFNIFILFISIIFFIFFYNSFKMEKNLILIIIITTPYFINVVLLGYIRQAIASIIFVYSLQYLIKKQFKLHIFWIIISSLFHVSSIINLIYIILSTRKKFIYYLPFILIFTYYFYQISYEKINHIIYFYVGPGVHLHSNGAMIRWIITVIPSIIFLFYSTRISNNKLEKNIYSIMSILIITLFPLILINTTLADRLLIYLMPIQFLVFSRLSLIFKKSTYKYMVNIFVVFYYNTINFSFIFFAEHSVSWLPYKFWLL